jgi:hypothetical protein
MGGPDPTDRVAVLEFHARFVAGDVAAGVRTCEALFPLVRRRLAAVTRVGDAHAVETAAEDALLSYLRDPASYDPNRGDLVVWLLKIALNRLRDIDRSTRRRNAHEVPAGVDLSLLRIKASQAAPASGPSQWVTTHTHALFVAARTPEERAAVRARLAGANRQAEFEALRLDKLSAARAHARLNQIWQNLRRRVRRLEDREKVGGRQKR